MRKAELHQKDYEAIKAHIISDIWFWIKDRDGSTLDVGERRDIPALVTKYFDEMESETIDELMVREDKVIAIASSTFDDVNEYELEEFEVPFLIEVLQSVEDHIELEDEE